MKIIFRNIIYLAIWLYRKPRGLLSLIKLRVMLKNVGQGTRADLSVEIKYPQNLSIGKNVGIGPSSTIGAHSLITIGDNVRISKGVTIETAGLDLSCPLPYPHVSKPIVISEGAWLGTRCIILGGVTIGKYAVIGAGAIVTKDIGDYEIVVSQPFRVIKKHTGE